MAETIDMTLASPDDQHFHLQYGRGDVISLKADEEDPLYYLVKNGGVVTMGNKPSRTKGSSLVRSEDEEGVQINVLLDDDEVFSDEELQAALDKGSRTAQQYADNLKLFEKNSRAVSLPPNDLTREDVKLRRTISLRQNREKASSNNSPIPSNLISDLLELSKSFRIHRSPLQKSVSAMSLRLVNIEESDGLLRKEPKLDRFVENLSEKSCSIPNVNAGASLPENSDFSCSSSSSETEYDTYKTHEDPLEYFNDVADRSDDDEVAVSPEDIDLEIHEESNHLEPLEEHCSPSPTSSTDSIICQATVKAPDSPVIPHESSADSCPSDNTDDHPASGELSPSDSCPSDSTQSDTDSCPSDSDSCPSDSEEEGDQFSTKDPPVFISSGAPRQRGRMSVVTSPSMSSVELNLTIKKRISKSCGDLSEITEDFIDHLKKLRTAEGENSGCEELDIFEKLSKQFRDEEDLKPGKLKRSSSQTITDRELKTIHETQTIWSVPAMVKKSKIALAILSIGARIGSVVQTNLGHATSVASDDAANSNQLAQPVPRGSSHPHVALPKKGIGRSFSFSMKNRTNLLSSKKLSRSKIYLKEDIMEVDGDCSEEEEEVAQKYPEIFAPSSEQPDPPETLSNSKRSMSLTNLNTAQVEKDLREMAEAAPKRVHSTEGLMTPPTRNHHHSCDELDSSQVQLEMTMNKLRTVSISTTEGKNDSSNEFSSDSEDREPRVRLSRSKSISMATRNIIFNHKKSVLKKKRCPPHNFVLVPPKPDLRCEGCSSETADTHFVHCNYCEFLVHKTCSELMLNVSPPPKEKKSHKGISFGLLQSKRPSTNESRDLTPSNLLRRVPSREPETSLIRRGSMVPHSALENNHIAATGRSISPTESDDEDYLTDDSETDSWKGSVSCISPCVVMTKDAEERLHGISELIETERNHIRNLKILLRVFKCKMVDKCMVNEEECNMLFPALDDLLASCTNLYTELKEGFVREPPHSNHMIGDILINNYSGTSQAGVCIRGAYARLGAKKLIAEKYYRDKCKDNKQFKSLMEVLESKKLCRRRTYPDFLLAVTTRLTKYPPLLKNLFKHTHESHPDYHSLREAITVVEDALQYINNFVRDTTNKADLEDFQTRFEVKGRCGEFKDFDLSSNKRRLIHRDQVTLQSIKAGGSNKIYQLFLYNDYILLLKEKDNKLILNFDDVQRPVLKVKGCLVTNDMTERTAFMLISNSGRHSAENSIDKIEPLLYRFSASTADHKKTWIKLMNEAISAEESTADTASAGGLSSDERFDSEDSDIDIVSPERDISVSFDSDTVNNFAETDASRNLTLDNIEEHNDSYLPESSLEFHEEEIDKLVTFLQNYGGNKSRRQQLLLNRPVNRPAPKPGTAARRAISLHVAEKQKRVEENRRHTTCLSKEELSQAISHSNQTLPSNQTLQDNPVRQKSSDSGYAAEDTTNQINQNPVLMKMRDCMLWVVQDSKKKSATINELRQEVADLRTNVEKKDADFTRMEGELKSLKEQISEQSGHSSHRPRPKRTYLNTYSNSISEEVSENPQTRV